MFYQNGYYIVNMARPERSARKAALVVADLFEAAGRLRRAGEGVARAVGQTQARWQVLSVISEGRWTVPRIAGRLGVTRQNVQRIADELRTDGLAEFAPNGRHARSPFVLLTASGREVLAALTARAEALDIGIARAIGEDDLDEVHAALARLLASLRENDGTN
jgi:DNA-binding MarR family transcriptional regulator